jgi:hypothetical protein
LSTYFSLECQIKFQKTVEYRKPEHVRTNFSDWVKVKNTLFMCYSNVIHLHKVQWVTWQLDLKTMKKNRPWPVLGSLSNYVEWRSQSEEENNEAETRIGDLADTKLL